MANEDKVKLKKSWNKSEIEVSKFAYIQTRDWNVKESSLQLQLQFDLWSCLDGLDQVNVGGDVDVAAGDNVNGVGGDINSGCIHKIRGPIVAELIRNLLFQF